MAKLNRLGRARVLGVMASAPSLSAAARQLGVRQSSVSRWVSLGKVPGPGRRRLAAVPLAAVLVPQDGAGGEAAPGADAMPPASAAEAVAAAAAWRRSLEQRLAFSTGESALLVLAEHAYAMALDGQRDDLVRLAATRTCAGLVKQLHLADFDGEPPSAA